MTRTRLVRAVLWSGVGIGLACGTGTSSTDGGPPPDSGPTGSDAGACGPGSCSGCCQRDTCIAGASQTSSACGSGGAACQACAAGATCQSGACLDPPVPDPGTQVGKTWTDVEPNDTPDKAFPGGVLSFAFWMGFAQPATKIGTNTDVDFFVFKTGDAASITGIGGPLSVCWSGGINLLDLYLYKVENSRKGPLVRSATTADSSCETVVDAGQASTVLAPNTVYLLEVRAAPGLNLGGNPGLYSA